MSGYAVAEEGHRPFSVGAIEELVGDDDMTGDDLFLHAPDRRDRDDPLDPALLHGVDIRPKGDFRGQKAMAATVTGEKDQLHAVQFAGDENVGGRTERGFDRNFRDIAQPLDLVETT